MRETVATGNVHVQTKPGLTAGISGNIKTLDLLLQLSEAGIELFVRLQINIYKSYKHQLMMAGLMTCPKLHLNLPTLKNPKTTISKKNLNRQGAYL